MGDTWHDMVVSEDVEKREVSYHMSTFSFWNFRFVQIFIVFFVVFCFFSNFSFWYKFWRVLSFSVGSISRKLLNPTSFKGSNG